MRGSFQAADFDVLADLWARQVPEKYRINSRILESHTVQSPVFDFEASHWEIFADKLKGFICIKRSANPKLFDGPNPLQAHLQAICFEDYAAGQKMLERAVEVLKSSGIVKLVFGQDSRHFYPGCPKDDGVLMQFLQENGFVAGEAEQGDLERDMQDYIAPAGCLEALVPPYEARLCTSADLPSLQAFFATTFSGRWRYDVLEKWNLEGPETVVGLFNTEEQTCLGFALIQQQGCRLPIGGAVWQHDLGAQWGSLGPIGIAESVRGKGLGDALLGAALTILKQQGARRTIIDWTTLYDFYGKHGFSVNRRYTTMSRDL